LRQRWFDDETQEATEIIRGLLNEAQREVLIVDAYFAGLELQRFALAVGHLNVPVAILTSAEGLKQSDPTASGVEKGDTLQSQLQILGANKHINTFSVRVMTGHRPNVHDRFLMIDDRVWLLGSSFNEFGSRGTIMVAVPYPAPVRRKLHEAWSEAEGLESWIEKRRASRITNNTENNNEGHS
jgi:hypothetical protein